MTKDVIRTGMGKNTTAIAKFDTVEAESSFDSDTIDLVMLAVWKINCLCTYSKGSMIFVDKFGYTLIH